MRGGKPVSEQEFEKLVTGLDESLSGSDSSESDSQPEDDKEAGKKDDSKLSALLKRKGKIEEDGNEDSFVSRKHTRGSGKPPLIWFNTSMLPSNTSLGIYRSLLSREEQQQDPIDVLRNKQLSPSKPEKPPDDEPGVPLPQPPQVGPHIFLCMIGGGHFAAMIVSLTPKTGKNKGIEERQASVIAHKTFHRYTTRRKQGGAQSSNDMAKGAAHSAGASIRRYNEEALVKEVRDLLTEWRPLINTSELIFLRATGSTNRRTLFGPYDNQVLYHTDPRIRGFPFSTRRATQSELMRCFVELTRVKIKEVDLAAEAAARTKAAEDAAAKAKANLAASKQKPAEKPKPARDPETEAALHHTTQLEALIRRSKGPALASYITSNALSPDFRLHPPDSQTHHHASTPLHVASSLNSPALIQILLIRVGADPTVLNGEGKTAFEIAGDRGTRDAFRFCRHELGEGKWDWGVAQVPEALSRGEVEERAARESAEQSAVEGRRREEGLKRVEEEEAERRKREGDRKEERFERKMGKGNMVGERQVTAEERREEEGRGMNEEVRRRLERERRARAVDARMARMQGGQGGS